MTESVPATSGQVYQIAINRPAPQAESNASSDASSGPQPADAAREQQQSVEALRADRAAEAQRNGRVDVYA